MLGALWLATALAAAPQAGATLDANSTVLISRPQFESVRVSPDGKLLAVVEHANDTSFVVVVNAADLTIVKNFNSGPRAEIKEILWVGSGALVVSTSHFKDRYTYNPSSNSNLYVGFLDKRSSITFQGSLIGGIVNDDQHFLINYCGHEINDKCKNEARLVDINTVRAGSGKIIADAPTLDAGFMADHTGAIRIAWAVDDYNEESLYVTDNGQDWKLLNDSKISSVKIFPEAISRDNKSLFLTVEHPEGPNSFDRYDFSTGVRTQLLRDALTDPRGTLMSLDGLEPVGNYFGAGRPEARFIDPSSQDAIFRASLVKAFPDTTASIDSVSADGNVSVIYTESDRDSGSYYLFDRKNHKAQFLFRAYPALDPKLQQPTEPFAIHARDGVTLTGFVTRPADHAGPSPMIVLVHGGPEETDTWYFDSEVQLFAQHGYAVLRVNYRGSGDFGRNFYRMGYKQWGATMQDDVTDATKWAIGQGIADAKRICIYGSNYGGYAALMGVVRAPDLYHCAASAFGIYDLTDLSGWGLVWQTTRDTHFYDERVGTDRKLLADRSPINHAADIKVPVLLMHGSLEGIVSSRSAELMRDALAKSGSTPIYLDYPEEYRGLEVTDHRLDYYSHLLNFFDTNLGVTENHVASKPIASP